MLEAVRAAGRAQQRREVLARALGRARQGPGLADDRVGGRELRTGRLGGVSEAGHGHGRGVRERAQGLRRVGQRGCRAVERRGHRERRLREPLELAERRAQLTQEAREAREGELEVGSALGRRGGGLAGVADERGDVVALAAQRRQDPLRVRREVGELASLAGEDREHPVAVAQGRVGAADDLGELVAAGGKAGAEVVEDQAQALARRHPHHVLDQVDVDRLAVVLERQQVLAVAGLSVGDLLERGRLRAARRPRPGRATGDVALADQRLRAQDAGGVGAEVLEARIGDVEHDDRLAVLLLFALGAADDLPRHRDVDRLDRARVRAGDADVLAGDDERAVVEHGADQVGLAVLPAGRHGRRERDRGDQPEGDGGEAPHEPPGRSSGSQSSGLSPLSGHSGATNGFESSGAGAAAAPGHGLGTRAGPIGPYWSADGIGSRSPVAPW